MNGFPFIMSSLGEAALSGSVVIILLLVLRPLIRRWFGARAVHALWLVVLVRLVIPWTPHTPMAVLPAPMENGVAMEPVTLRSFVIGGNKERISPPATTPERRPEPRVAVKAGTVELIWLLGVAGVFGLSLAGALRAAPLVRRARKITADSVAMRVLASLPMSVRGLRILETDELKSPALCGWIRPAILLPPGWAQRMEPEELRCVLLHEIGHHRRGDVLWRWAFLAARAIHWFNPLVWIAEREMRIDQEMACDEWVLAHDRGIDSQKYGEALLRACRNLSPLRIASPGHATMAESSAGLAQRIRRIARMKTHGWPALAGTAALAAALCVIGPSPGVAQHPAQAAENPPAGPVTASAPSSTPTPSPDVTAKDGPAPGTNSSAGPAVPAPTAKAKETLVEIEAKFVERSSDALKDLAKALPGDAARADSVSILEDSQFQVVFRTLSRMKGVDLLSAPRVTCKSGQKAVVEMIREFRYPTEFNAENDGTGRTTPSAFETRNVGITLNVTPTVGDGGQIDMALTPSVVEFAGFVNYGAGRPRRQTLKGDALTELMKSPSTRHQINQPIFNTRTISTIASIHSGQTVIVGGVGGFNGADTPSPIAEWKELSRRGGSDGDSTNAGGKSVRVKKAAGDKTEKYLLIFVSARVLNP
jgi:beta-lactamase regulating signal transducer with metallopeptidase domain